MNSDKVLAEAKRLYDLGFGIHWLHKKSKRPVESGWTSGPRKSWPELVKSYRPGLNVGVRLGAASKVGEDFLAVIDVDVKSKLERHGKEVLAKVRTLTNGHTLPEVKSGRGNDSRHYYILTEAPIKPFKAMQSPEVVKVHMPSVAPSKKEMAMLTKADLEAGWRLRPAWEISVMGEGQQVVLPPSIHPDSGKHYAWQRDFVPGTARGVNLELIKPHVDKSVDTVDNSHRPGPKTIDDFEVSPVELAWLPIDDKIRGMITTGEGVEDRSAMLLPVATALFRAGLNQNEVLTVLTDPTLYLGATAYHHAKTKSRKRAAAWLWKYTVQKVIRENSAEAIFADVPTEPAPPLSKEERIKEERAFKDIYDWRLDLEVTKAEKIRGTLQNIVMILANVVGKDFIRRDTFAWRDYYNRPTPWGGRVSKAVEDDDLVLIKHWLAENEQVEPTTNVIGEALTVLANRNSFDPVKDWLLGLPAWDGTERLDTWLKKNFEAKGDPEYLAQVFRKWLCAMVIRVLNPGVKFDWMPIFEGAQGIGKSSFGRVLVGDKYFLDNLPDLSDKDSALALQGIWAVEMSELASFRKNEIEIVKSFITRTVDKVRPPYGQRWREIHRRCVFFGTTNYETYLKDESGNRRFKPVLVGQLDFEVLEAEREQLFAEALWLYRHGFENERTLEINGDAKVFEVELQASKMISDESALMEDAIRKFINREMSKPKTERFNFSKFQIADLFGGEGSPFMGPPPLKNWRYDARNVQFCGKALKALNAANWKSAGLKYWKLTIGEGQ